VLMQLIRGKSVFQCGCGSGCNGPELEADTGERVLDLLLYSQKSHISRARVFLDEKSYILVEWNKFIVGNYTSCPEKSATLFSTITLTSHGRFLYFCTIRNRNEYSRIMCNFLT